MTRFPSRMLALLIILISSSVAGTVHASPNKWRGAWNIDTDHYKAQARFQNCQGGEFLCLNVVLKNKRTNKPQYEFQLTCGQLGRIKSGSIHCVGDGIRLSKRDKFSAEVQLFRYQKSNRAAGFFRLNAGRRSKLGGAKLPIIITRR